MTLLLTGAGPATDSSTLAPIDPATLSPAAWWKADALALSDGAAVSSWTDSSGNAKTLTQATGANQPVYKTAIVNGKPVVRFTPANASFVAGADLSALTSGLLFFVMKKNADPASSDLAAGAWDFGTDATDTHIPYTDGVIYDATGTNSRKIAGNPAPSLAAWNIYEVSAAAGAWTVYLNGTQIFTTATNVVGFPANVKVGQSHVSTRYFDGDIAEIIVFGSVLSTANRQGIEAWLKAKYGTP